MKFSSLLQSKAVLQYAGHSHAAEFLLYQSVLISFLQFIKLHWEGERERFYSEMGTAVMGLGNGPTPKLPAGGNSEKGDGKGKEEVRTHTE